jgi:hypothetical protein
MSSWVSFDSVVKGEGDSRRDYKGVTGLTIISRGMTDILG